MTALARHGRVAKRTDIMAIKDIFTILELQPRTCRQRPWRSMNRLGGELRALASCYEPLAPGFLGSPAGHYIVGAMEEAQRQAKEAAERFGELALQGAAPPPMDAGHFAGATTTIVSQAYLSDLAMSQEDPDRPEPIEAVLFEAGVPLLWSPSAGAAVLGLKRAVIAGDVLHRPCRARRAAAAGDDGQRRDHNRRLLAQPRRRAADVARYLARHGLSVTVNTVARDAVDVAGTVNAHLREVAADFL